MTRSNLAENRTDHKKGWRAGALFLALLSGCLWAAGCGQKADVPPEETQVLGVTITPVPTPTPEPYTNYPKALAEKNGVTFVNQYLIDDMSR
ncbi:MAG: hypothetical protein IIY55_08345 [Blautia sp.]|nr:hypothetical protein [Blautia sp.]